MPYFFTYIFTLCFGSSWASKPVKLTDDVEQKKTKEPYSMYNNQTPPRANKTKKKYYGFLHRGKLCILQILSMQKCFLKNVSASYTFSISLKFGNFSLNILRKYILVKNEEKGLCPAVRKVIKQTHAPKSHISVDYLYEKQFQPAPACAIFFFQN